MLFSRVRLRRGLKLLPGGYIQQRVQPSDDRSAAWNSAFPWQIVASITLLCIFGILMWRYKHKSRDGEIFLLYIALYATGRFLLEFLRGDPNRGYVVNHLLSTSQFIALLVLGFAAVLAYRWYGPGRKATSFAGSVNPKVRLQSKVKG